MNERPERRDHADRGPRKSENPRGSGDQRRDSRAPRNEGGYNNDRGPRREGEFKPRREGEFKPRREGEFKPRREGDFKPRREGGYNNQRSDDRGPRREGEFKPRREGGYNNAQRDDRGPRRDFGDRAPRRDGDAGQRREGGYNNQRSDDRGPRREGEFKPRREGGYNNQRNDDRGPRREGEFKPRREGGYNNAQRDDRGPRRDFGDRAPRRDGDAGQRREGGYNNQRSDDRGPRREGEFKPRREGGYNNAQRDDRGPRRDFGDRAPRRDGDAGQRREGGYNNQRSDDRGPRRDDRNDGRNQDSYGRGGTRGAGRSDRGGSAREFTEAERLQHALRPVRSEHKDPIVPDEIEAKDLHPAARNELKTLQAETAESVARHLAMVAYLIDEEPELAHQHALSASRRAGRIPVARETLAITAYRTGDFALALRELRTYRRLSGLDGHLALMVDCERGLGRPEKAIETAQEADKSNLEVEERVLLAIAVSGARLDLGQTQQALFELEIAELNPKKAFSWSPALFGAYGAVLEDLGRDAEAARWFARADQAEDALQAARGGFDELEVIEIREDEYALEQYEREQANLSVDLVDNETAAEELIAEAVVEAEVTEEAESIVVEAESVEEIATEIAEAETVAEAEKIVAEAEAPALSVEDEVAEILADAGITDEDEEEEAADNGSDK